MEFEYTEGDRSLNDTEIVLEESNDEEDKHA